MLPLFDRAKRIKCESGPLAEIDFVQSLICFKVKLLQTGDDGCSFSCSLQGAGINGPKFDPCQKASPNRFRLLETFWIERDSWKAAAQLEIYEISVTVADE